MKTLHMIGWPYNHCVFIAISDLIMAWSVEACLTVVVGPLLSVQQETHLGEDWVAGLEVSVEGAFLVVSAEIPAVGLGAHVRHGLEDVVVQQPQVVLLAPHGAVLGLRDAVLAGVDLQTTGEENTNLPGGESPTVVVSEELAVCSQRSTLQIRDRDSHKM